MMNFKNKIGKKTILYCLVSFSMLGLPSCSDDYDDAWIKETTQELENRVAALEEWQKSVNKDISSLQDLIAALEDKDYVTGITPLGDGKGYVISFLKSGDITIKNGEKGDKGDTGAAPNISAKQDADGKYYWTINGEWLLDDNNNKMPVTGEKGDKGDQGESGLTPHIGDNGNWWIGTTDTGIKAKGENGQDGKDAIAPIVRINPTTNEWEISTDGGSIYNSTGIKATGEKGDAFFENVDNTNQNYVVITLKNGEVIKLPKITDGVYVAEAGGLLDAVRDAGIDPYTVTKLKIAGTLNDTDFGILNGIFKSLILLDLENVDITILPEFALQEMPFETVILPKGLKEIGKGAFYSCTSLRTLDIPESVDSLGKWMVEKCSNLETVRLHNGLKKLTQSTFFRCGISSIHIPRTVTEIPAYCFSECSNLKQIYLHNEITSIGEGAFKDCYALEQFTVPQGVTVLSLHVMSNCTNLNRVNLHEGITSIEAAAFENCKSLRTVVTPEFSKEGKSPEQLPKSLKSLETRAFAETALETISLGSTQITMIDAFTFKGCKYATSVHLPETLRQINLSAFESSGIKYISIPPKVVSIGDKVFAECHNLMEVKACRTGLAPTIREHTFPDNAKENCVLRYPEGSDYSSWTQYFKKSETIK